MKLLFFLAALLCAGAGARAQAAYDNLIFPDPSRKIILVNAAKSEGKPKKGRELPVNDPVSALISKELEHPYYAALIRLNQCSRNYGGNTAGPNVLYLSQNEGGFARQGLELLDGPQAGTYPDLHYVDLVVDATQLSQGKLDIFAHELGHVMMGNIWTSFEAGLEARYSPKMHCSMGVTDQFTAVFEGFGEHFQLLTQENIPLYYELFSRRFRRSDNTVLAWHSSIDEEARLHGVLDNRYLHRRLMPAGYEFDSLSAEQRILLEHASPVFDPTRVRNAQELLACEGWAATVFYRIAHDTALANRYAGAAFYRSFLIRDFPAGVTPRDVFSPFENILLKHFAVWKALNTRDLKNKAVLIEYVRLWTELFPTDREPMLRLFIGASAGATVDAALPRQYEALCRAGVLGDYRAYAEALDANVGPELWIEHPTLQIRHALWMPEPTSPLRVNVNNAGLEELAAFWGREKALQVLLERDRVGYFRSMEEVKALGGE